MSQKIHSTTYIANLLEVKPSTVRKYVLILESKGYIFIRNDKNQRLYTNFDLPYLQQFKKLIDDNGMTLDDAATLIAERFIKADHGRHSDTFEDQYSLEAKVDKLLEYIERQDRFNRELLAKLDEQQRYITESLEKRDRDLMNALNETRETKKLMLAAKEDEKERKESRGGLFARLFGK